MLKIIKNLLERNAYLISILLTISISWLSLSPLEKYNIHFSTSDKILHALAYTILTLSWVFSIKKAHKSNMLKIKIGLAICLFGIIIEVLQSNITTYRTGDYLDVLANTIGITLALVIFNRLFKQFKIIF